MKGKKTGGRKQGTPNKDTGSQLEMIGKATGSQLEMIDKATGDYFNSDQFRKDLDELTPRERLSFMEKLVNYVLAKMHSSTIEATVEERGSIEDRLLALARDNGL